MTIPGPCCICGGTNYELSCDGPTICPKCDCGHFDAATVEQQARIIKQLREQNERFARAIEYGDEDFDGEAWEALIKEAEQIATRFVHLRGGPGFDFPCNDTAIIECAQAECQRAQACRSMLFSRQEGK